MGFYAGKDTLLKTVAHVIETAEGKVVDYELLENVTELWMKNAAAIRLHRLWLLSNTSQGRTVTVADINEYSATSGRMCRFAFKPMDMAVGPWGTASCPLRFREHGAPTSSGA